MSPRRYQSQPDDAPAPEFVYSTLREHDVQLDELAAKLDELGDSVKDAVRELKSSNGTETRKLIAAIACSALTVLGGVLGMAKLERPAPPPVTSRSALDIRLGVCRAMGPGPSRQECYARVTEEVERP